MLYTSQVYFCFGTFPPASFDSVPPCRCLVRRRNATSYKGSSQICQTNAGHYHGNSRPSGRCFMGLCELGPHPTPPAAPHPLPDPGARLKTGSFSSQESKIGCMGGKRMGFKVKHLALQNRISTTFLLSDLGQFDWTLPPFSHL